MTHVDLHHSNRRLGIKTPDPIKDLFFGQNHAFILDEIDQQIEFFSLDRQGFTICGDFFFREVAGQVLINELIFGK